MRILMLTDFYPPDYIGGVERHVQTLARELVRRGHHVAVATLQNHKDSPAFELDEGVRVHRHPGWNRVLTLLSLYEHRDFQFHPPVPDPGAIAGLRRVIEQERPDIVHAHSWILYSFVPLKAWSRAKLVVTFHTYGLVCPTLGYVHSGQVCTGPSFGKCIRCAGSQYGIIQSVLQTSGLKLSAPLHRYVDRFIAESSAVRDVSSKGIGKRPIEVVPAVIPDGAVDEASQVDRPTFLPPTDDYILFVGRQYAHGRKGLDVLLDAYAGLPDPVPLVLILAEPDRGISPQFPAGVTIARQVPHAQVMAAWAHCNIGVVPSVWPEPFGLVAVEAMVCGKPVVASATGGLLDVIVDGETGLLVPPGDAIALREALRALLSDPARRAQMGVAGRQRARLFSVGVVTDRIEQIYTEVLGR